MTSAALPQFVIDILAVAPRAGEGVNLWLFRAGRVLHPYRTPQQIADLLRAAVEGCGRPVTESEIRRAIERSATCAWTPGAQPAPRNAWPSRNDEQREAVVTSIGLGVVDLWEASPIRWDDRKSHTEEIIDALFPGNPLLCVGKSNHEFVTETREELRGRMADMALVVPSPMTARTGTTQEGRVSAHTLENTGPRRYLIVEQDGGSLDEQAAVLFHLSREAPLTLAVFSGSKSLHGWFYCGEQPEARLRQFMESAVVLGADRATWTRSQFVRMPDGTRDNGNKQTTYFLNPRTIKDAK